jgi:chemotaxis protein MotB
MPKEFWKITGVVTLAMAAIILAVVVWQLNGELKSAREKASAAFSQSETNAAESARLREELEREKALAAELAEQKAAVAASQSQLEKEMRAVLDSKDVTISELQGRLTMNILDQILFDSGEAVLKPNGQQVLWKIATVLATAPDRQIHIIGHTDNVPIRASGKARFASNWELSSARALAAVRFMQEQCGLDPKRLGALGYGEFRPVADNATAEGRAQNRRIEVVVLPVVPASSPASPVTNQSHTVERP